MTTITEDTIANRISRILADRIITGALEPGSRLRQDHIAEEFGTSHVPVREAFRRLEAQGLAVSEARRGVRVASFSLAEVQEVARMRSVLEGLALRHAAPHLTPFILSQAETAMVAGDRASNIREWDEENRRFHRLLLAPCDMPRLLAAIDDLHTVGSRLLFVSGRGGWKPRVDVDHHAILDHLRKGKIEQAIVVLDRHVQRIGQKPIQYASGATGEAFAIEG
ncbi:GntR family transcriptional regulator [Rhizobium leguminosarum]|uniref:GntR family transcriptional regulator n=1 Tax=Rhizobium TaxID=379 RepID=UPI001441210D|nr:GntR family transcriptional regulator [Rhizobium leguminosarum]NKL12744.1 FCD domain-containing protein [Rhizobium leguminosarum bv. viciae]MBY5392948.1 GntR family transcriptional regulator [Rhizobium leguminosarum]MBY5434433.1 GntR family transcriptional regulator [Rhizobium leguminosarum]MBY5882392.1 GntR family transcriptional regulator [Rhizobium leguminosarum]NKL41728.1 FCD domain-containing protein [Rhizobium leguminosarum bv. viciae]